MIYFKDLLINYKEMALKNKIQRQNDIIELKKYKNWDVEVKKKANKE